MSRRFLPHLRRCRLPFALALCAWLMLVSMAWAQSGCCDDMPGAGSAMTMDGHMGGHAGAHDMDHHASHPAGHTASDCTCTHAPATLPTVAALGLPSTLPSTDGLAQPDNDTPQPASKPPLRPPAA
ncbi:hypothetical protein [Dyella subtropica]|uniref:hypothetical protein n=1 Tax=Dyella subtropica TaxID=2992127 RepID=UPI002251C0F2|nr:hypothetical protein [Dyella subtropica]